MSARLRLSSLLAAVALLAGCGGDGDSGSDGPPAKPPFEVVQSGKPADGRDVFADSCAGCHGDDGGGGSGPALAGRGEYTNADVVVEQIRDGGGGMPAFEGDLSEQELADVSAFVVKELAR